MCEENMLNWRYVVGECDVNNQRVIPGAESDNSLPPSILSPLQNLHIQDDNNFVNISMMSLERNLNVDGMETVPETQLRSVDPEPREEDIDGANDISEEFNALPTTVEHNKVSNEPESREEAIEGANDEISSKTKKQKSDLIDMSSGESELRSLARSTLKPKSRRTKKYTEDSNESENDYSDDDMRRRTSRDKPLREDYDKYRRKEKERRTLDRSRRGDDSGRKYGDSRKRSDDEDDNRRQHDKNKKSSKNEAEGEDREYRKREKHREVAPRRSRSLCLACLSYE